MPGFTKYYNLAYFDFGDELDTTINAQLESDRFVTIDRQLYGLYNIFGDGIISGWTVFDNGYTEAGGISIGITDGLGIVKFTTIQTENSNFISSLVPNSTIYIYALPTSNSSSTRGVSFIASLTTITGFALLLAVITTEDSSISLIDNNVRDFISFEQNIVDEISSHRHREGNSKIDLVSGVKGLLPGSKIDGFDVDKLETGKLSEERIPLLDHNELENAGNMSHAQVDAVIETISDDNLGLLGEISTVNQIKQIVFLRYRYDDVDKYFVNELVIIPGLSPDSQIDKNATSALIDEDAGCIIGYPVGSSNTFFFTQNFTLPARVTKAIITSNKSVPADSSISFGVNTTNSVDFDDYTVVTEDSVSDVPLGGDSLRVGIKFVWTGEVPIFDESEDDFIDFVYFYFENTGAKQDFHFRARYYDSFDGVNVNGLFFTAESIVDQERWFVTNQAQTFTDGIPCCGYEVDTGEEFIINYYPDLSRFLLNKRYYVVIDVWDGSSYSLESDPASFRVGGGSNVDLCTKYDYLPIVKNFGIMFELENSQFTTLNF